jgi:hypothetical protein
MWSDILSPEDCRPQVDRSQVQKAGGGERERLLLMTFRKFPEAGANCPRTEGFVILQTSAGHKQRTKMERRRQGLAGDEEERGREQVFWVMGTSNTVGRGQVHRS